MTESTSPPPSLPDRSSSGEMTLLEHLGELRRRLIVSFVIVLAGTVVTYSCSAPIFGFLTQPHFAYFPPHSLIGTGPAEAFVLKIKVAIFAALFLTAPLLFYQVWLFIAPGLLEHEKRLVVPFVAATSTLFILGAWFAYRGLVPISISFFKSQYDSIGVTPQITVREHVSLMVRLLLGCGVIAQTPVAAYFAGRLNLVSPQFLIDKLRHAVVIVFIISAIITPTPDIVTQCAFAIPLLVLYGLSIGIVWLVQREAPPAERKETL